jgi:hypothetical protein
MTNICSSNAVSVMVQLQLILQILSANYCLALMISCSNLHNYLDYRR